MDLAHAIQVDDRGAVHAEEALGIEPALELGHRLAQQVRRAADVERDVVVGGLDPVDLLAP